MILATVDIEDLATPKLAGVRSALAETAQATRQYAAEVARNTDNVRTVGQVYAEQAARVATLTEGYRALSPVQANVATSSAQVARAQEAVARSTGAVTSALSANMTAWQLQLGALTSLAGGMTKIQTIQAALERQITSLGAAMEREKSAALTLMQANEANAKATADLQRTTATYTAAMQASRAATDTLAKASSDLARVQHDIAAGALTGSNAARMLAAATKEQAAAQKAVADTGAVVAKAHNDVTAAAQKATLTTGYLRDAELKLVPVTDAVVAAEQKLAATHELVERNAGKLTVAQQQVATTMQRLGSSLDKSVQEGVRNVATGFEKMSRSMLPGVTVTDTMAASMKVLGASSKEAGLLVGPLNGTMRTLLQGMKPGATITKATAQAFDELHQGVQGFAGVLPPAAAQTEKMTGALVAMTAALGAITAGLGMYFSHATDAAAKAEAMAISMDVVAKNAYIATSAMQGQVEVIKSYGVSTEVATSAVTDFAQANLQIADASKLAKVAMDLAVVAGKSVDQTMTALTRAVQTQQITMLRHYGITKSVSQVMKAYAADLGKAAKELTVTERQQAILNMILTEGSQVAGAYAATLNTVSGVQSQIATASEELAVKIGNKLLPAQLALSKLQLSLYEGAMKLSDGWTALAVAIGIAALAITSIGAVISGAKLLGLGTLLMPVIAVIKDFITYIGVAGLSTETFAATGSSAVALMGPWGLALGAIVLVLAALAAAYVYTTAQEQAYIEAGREAQAADAKAKAEIENYTKTLEQFTTQAAVTTSEKRRMKDAADALNRAVGAGTAVIDTQTGMIKLNSDALETNTAKLEANAAARVKAARAELEQIKVEMAHRDIEMQTMTAVAEAPGASDNMATAVQASNAALAHANEVAKQRIAELEKQLGVDLPNTVEGAYDAATTALREASHDFEKELDSGVTEAAVLRRVASEDSAGKKLVAKIRNLKEQLDKSYAEAAASHDPSKIMTGDKIKALYEEVGARYEQLANADADAAERAGKKFQNALKNMRERIAGETVEMRAQAQALNEELARIFNIKDSGDRAEALETFERRFASMVKSLGINVKDLARNAPLVKDFFDKLEAEDLANWTVSIKKNLRESVVAVESSFEDMRIAMNFDYAQEAHAQQQEIVKARRDTAQEIFEIDRALYEESVVQYMNAGDQMIYAEKKRIEDLQRSFDLEETVRKEAMAEQARQLELKVEQQKQETLNLARNVRVRTELRELEMRHAIEIDKDKSPDRKAKELAAIDAAHLQFGRLLEEQVQYNLDAIEADAELRRALLAQSQQAGQEMSEEQRKALERQKAQAEANIKAILKSTEAGVQLMKGIWAGLSEGVGDALAGILNQTSTWKEAFIGIWKSLQSALNRVWQNMLNNWIDTATQMATKGGGFDIKALVSGLLGKGQGVGTGAGGGVIGTTGPYGMGGYLDAGGKFIAARGAQGAMIATTGVGAGVQAGSFSGQNVMGAGLVAGKAGVWKAGSGFAKGAVGGAMMGGAVGGIVGTTVAQRYADGSYARGVLSGAASGAAAGGAVGGWWGAAAGGVMGAVGGYFAARKQRQQVKTDRADIIQNAGGIEQLKVQAEAAGVNIDKFLSTKRVKEFQAEVKKLNEAFQKLAKDQMITAAGGEEMFRAAAAEAGHFEQATVDAFINGTLSAEKMREVMEKMQKDLELKEAKDSLARTVSQMDELRRVAVLAGYDLKKLYDAKTIEEFNAQQAQLNKLLEAQQLRLDGLNTAAQGLTLRVQGLAMSYTKGLEAFVTGLGKQQQDAWKALVEGTKEGEKSLIQRLREAMADAKGGAVRVGDLELSSKQAADLAAQFEKVQKAVNNIGGAAAATFGGILRETGSLKQAFDAIGEPLDLLNQILQETGAEAPAALHHLLSLRQAVQANADIVTSLEGINMMLKGLSDSGQLTEQMFNDLGRDAADQWEEMKARGVAEDQALLMMQPTLQALYEAQKNFGFATDDATANLIKMGQEQGLVGDQFQSINQKMLDMLMIIAEAVGGTIPEAYRKQGQAATAAGQAQEEAAQAAIAEQQRLAAEQEEQRLAAEAAALALATVAQVDMSQVAGGVEDIHSYVEPIPGAAEDALIALEDMNDVDMEILKRKLEETQKAIGTEDGLAYHATISKQKVEEINDVDMSAIKGELGGTKDGAYEIAGGAGAATDAILRMVDDTRGPLAEMEANIRAISLGRSPGGLKEIKIQAEAGETAIRELGRATIAQALAMERALNSLDATVEADNVLAANYAAQTGGAPREEPAREPAAVNHVQVTFNVPVAFNTLDPSKASDAWEIIRPGFETALRSNTKQIGTLVEDAARRHRRKVQA